MALSDPDVERVFERYNVELQRIFRHYAAADQTDDNDDTMNIKEFLRLLKQCNLLDERLPQQVVINLFMNVQDGDGIQSMVCRHLI